MAIKPRVSVFRKSGRLFILCLSLALLLYTADSALFHRDTAVLVVAELYDNGVAVNIDNDTDKTGCGQYAVTDFHSGNLCCQPLLFLFLGSEQDKPECKMKIPYITSVIIRLIVLLPVVAVSAAASVK